MTHALIPDFSAPLPTPATFLAVPVLDPVLAAIDAHADAWAVFQVAPAGRPAEVAEDVMSLALEDLLATPCGSRFGALALIRHLRWLIAEEAISADADGLTDRLVLAREADLSRFVGPNLPPDHLPEAMPLGRLAAGIVRRLPPTLDTIPDAREPVPSFAPIVMGAAGELLTALAIIAGGVLAYGFLPLA